MKALFAATALTALALSTGAFAQGQAPQTQHSSQSTVNSNPNQDANQTAAAAQKIRQDLASAGFTDVKVVAESFVVQAKTKDGNPVVMTIGPHGMSVFEAMNTAGTNSSTNTTGSSANSNAGSGTTGSSSNSATGSTSNK